MFLNLISNWFGLINGSIFGKAPVYVDTKKAPGFTPIPKPTPRPSPRPLPRPLLCPTPRAIKLKAC